MNTAYGMLLSKKKSGTINNIKRGHLSMKLVVNGYVEHISKAGQTWVLRPFTRAIPLFYVKVGDNDK